MEPSKRDGEQQQGGAAGDAPAHMPGDRRANYISPGISQVMKEFQELRQQNAVQQQTITQLERRLRSSPAPGMGTWSMRAQLQIATEKLKGANAELHHLYEVQAELDSKSRSLATVEKEVKRLRDELVRVKLANLKAENENRKSQVEEIENLKKELAEVMGHREELWKREVELEDELKAAEMRIVQMEDNLATAERRNGELEAKANKLENEAYVRKIELRESQGAGSRNEELEARVTTLEKEASKKDKLIAKLTREADDAKTLLLKRGTKIDELTAGINTLTKQLTTATTTAEELTVENGMIHAEFNELKDSAVEMQKEIDGLKGKVAVAKERGAKRQAKGKEAIGEYKMMMGWWGKMEGMSAQVMVLQMQAWMEKYLSI